jgi:hypothetical protein
MIIFHPEEHMLDFLKSLLHFEEYFSIVIIIISIVNFARKFNSYIITICNIMLH